ncbi:MAG: (d)CMP kinase [Candidatus Parabeggiatoa sp. nov. 3]|nr:MAG: (d)CMP kinase [Gammaproteobacteria bacterium]RKZ57940.1 MAG: (d)CMP kinase [Gammaproteobacteria bacterium]RKZ89001.1 MAG: (d)CMP kinase [Gammaproteobacteria bacterium]HEW97825.1 (d)CMP kinase [Beggiatoa sp.]
MKNTTIPIVTLDGPGGSGKGTVSLILATQLGWHMLDSGALYRGLALAAHRHNVSLDNETALATLAAHLDVQFKPLPDLSVTQVILEGQDVSRALRSEACGTAASQIATIPAVRQALLARQRAFLNAPGLVADGRDMGTVVFPSALIKIFLTASIEERAKRRYKQLINIGIDAKLPTLITEIAERDQRDSTRNIAPLMAADDANIIDTTGVFIDNVVASILSVIRKELSVVNMHT